MIYSMTAFSNMDVEFPLGILRWEMRSVNHRYCELNFKLPDIARHLEGVLRNIVRDNLHRGKIDCCLKIDFFEDNHQSLNVDFERIEKIINTSHEINEQLKRYQLNAPISPLEILQWPHVLQTTVIDAQILQTGIETSFQKLLLALKEARAREGHALKLLISERILSMQVAIVEIKNFWQNNIHVQGNKLKDKLNELNINVDANRLEQEILYFTQKSDISEELDRLQTHVAEIGSMLATGGMIGKKLDFFMQELNREANTIASKVQDVRCIHTAVSIKVLIEEIREQIQNLE